MPAITDISGILVGHAQDGVALTGCTVVIAPPGTVGAVDVRGGAPGTRETDLLSPTMLVQSVDAIMLCGGSAFGLDAASGVMRWLREQQRGFETGVARVPIVPAAVLFDLGIGKPVWPDASMGYAACVAATTACAEGNVGAGTGASAGKLRGLAGAMKTGIGTWSERLPDGTTIGALVAANPFGDLCTADGQPLAGVRLPDGSLPGTTTLLRAMLAPPVPGGFSNTTSGPLQNTTLAVIATDAILDKAAATRVAQMAHDGLARRVRPVHTPFDGDVVFVLATNQRPAPPLTALGSLAAEVLEHALERAATTALPAGGLPAAHR